MKIEESWAENRQSVTASGSSISEGSYGFSRMSQAASSPVTSSPSHRRTIGPICRAKSGWTQEDDETLRRAVFLHKGGSWKKIDERRMAAEALQIAKNVLSVDQGVVNPLFQGLSPFANDPTNPLIQTAESLASLVVNVPPIPTAAGSSTGSRLQTKNEVQQLLIRTAAKIGFLFEKAHLEDLYAISSTDGLLTDRDVWLYLRGAMRSNQISATTALSKLLTSVESILLKNQQTMMDTADSNKQVAERLTLINRKVEVVVPTVCSMVQAEHSITRGKIAVPTPQTSSYSLPAILEHSSESATPAFPSEAEIMLICKAAGCPESRAKTISDKYVGKITWDEYRIAMSGTLSAAEIKKLMFSWKLKA